MQVTISLSELQEFERAYTNWVRHEQGIFLEIFATLSREEKAEIGPLASKVLNACEARRADYMRRHPEPKLIPSV